MHPSAVNEVITGSEPVRVKDDQCVGLDRVNFGAQTVITRDQIRICAIAHLDTEFIALKQAGVMRHQGCADYFSHSYPSLP